MASIIGEYIESSNYQIVINIKTADNINGPISGSILVNGSMASFAGSHGIDTVNTTGYLVATLPSGTMESWTFTASTANYDELKVERRYAGHDNVWNTENFTAKRNY